MRGFTRCKTVAILGVTAFLCLAALPNVLPASALARLPAWAQRTVPLGIDLTGGTSVVLAVDADYVRQERVQRLRDDIRQKFREARVGHAGLFIRQDGVEARIRDQADMPRIMAKLSELAQLRPDHRRFGLARPIFFPDSAGRPSLTANRNPHVPPAALDIRSDGDTIRLTLNDAVMRESVASARRRSLDDIAWRLKWLEVAGTVRAVGPGVIVFHSPLPDALVRLSSVQF